MPATAATGAMYCTTFVALCPPEQEPGRERPQDRTHSPHGDARAGARTAHGGRVVRRRDSVQRVVGAEKQETGDAAARDDRRVIGRGAQRHQRDDERAVRQRQWPARAEAVHEPAEQQARRPHSPS